MAVNVKTILAVVVVINIIAVVYFFRLSSDTAASNPAGNPGPNRRAYRKNDNQFKHTNEQDKTPQSQDSNNNQDDLQNNQPSDPLVGDDVDLPIDNNAIIKDDILNDKDDVQKTKDNKAIDSGQKPAVDDLAVIDDDLDRVINPQDDDNAQDFLDEPPKKDIASRTDSTPKNDKQPITNNEPPKNDTPPKADEAPKPTVPVAEPPKNEAPPKKDKNPKLTSPIDEAPKNSTAPALPQKNDSSNDPPPQGKPDSPAPDDLLSDSKPNDSNPQFIELEKKVIELGDVVDMQRDYLSVLNPFRVLGFYKELDLKYFDNTPGAKPHYATPHTGLKKNPAYCDYTDLYNLFNPTNIYDHMHFVTDYDRSSIPRAQVMEKIGTDVMPEVAMDMSGFFEAQYDLDLSATMFFTKKVDFHFYQEVGKQFLCVTQMYNHIPGCGAIIRKDSLVGSVNAYADYYKDHPQCFNKKTFFPYAYQLNNETECKQFFKEINDEAYFQLKKENPLNYLLKLGYGAHRASGVFLFNDAEERKTRKTYQNGSLCGNLTLPVLAQKYISNALLLDKQNKFDFRMYMLITSTDPLIVYYHDGFLRVSLEKYEKNSTDRNVHLTNTHLSKQKLSKIKNKTLEAELRDYQMWTLDQLQEYLMKSGKINDTNWLDNYLRPMFKKAFLHLIRMSRDSYWKHSSVYEMFGLDFMLDDNLGLWLIEVNGSPQLVGTSAMKEKLMVETLSDMFEIQYAYLRSKVKRLYAIVHRVQNFMYSRETFDIEEVKEEFTKANRNFLEPEWQIRSNISWHKILDENIPGKGAYMGILEDECILER